MDLIALTEEKNRRETLADVKGDKKKLDLK
jgi:hypothetical protein